MFQLFSPKKEIKGKYDAPYYEEDSKMIRANFTIRLSELDADLIEKLKGVFNKDNIIEINVVDELDETEYLFSTASNRESLYRSLEQFKRGEFVTRHEHELEG
jgi:hypothetical protein